MITHVDKEVGSERSQVKMQSTSLSIGDYEAAQGDFD